MKRSHSVLSYLVIASLPFFSIGIAEAKAVNKTPRQQAAVKKSKGTTKVALAAASVAAPAVVVAGSVEPAPAAAPLPGTDNPVQAGAPAAPAQTNPYLVPQQWITSAAPTTALAPQQWIASAMPTGPVSPQASIDQLVMKLKSSLNSIPLFNDEAILPRIKTVHPTGEKPLVVLTFKCPTEAIGISTPPIKAMRELVNLSMAGANRSNLLPFNMQQVCQ